MCRHRTLLLPVLLSAVLWLPLTGPQAAAEPTHYDMTLKMSSVLAVEDCESTGNSPGEFRYRLILRQPDAVGNEVMVHDTGYQQVTASSGDRSGVTMDDIQFRVPNAPGSSFQVEYWIGERDGSSMDFENHSWATHRIEGRDG